MKKRNNKSKRIFFKFYNFLIVLLLSFPLINLGYRIIDNMLVSKIREDTTQNDNAIASYHQPDFSKSIDNALCYTLDGTVDYTIFGNIASEEGIEGYSITSMHTLQMIVAELGRQSGYSPADIYDLYIDDGGSFNLCFTNFNFTKVFRLHYVPADFNNWGRVFFLNYYLNYLLDMTLICFIPYVLLCISQWFMSLTEDLTTRTNKED